MRKNIVAGNWKMNTTVAEGVQLAKEVNEAVAAAGELKCDVVIGVPFTHLTAVKDVIDIEKVGLSAENCANKEKGAYTGEVSAAMVASTGANYVILGHSERREYYNETPEILKEKVDLALANGLKIIFCCGESLELRNAGTYEEFIKAELKDSLFHLSAEEFANIVIAYEPIWAIGTGKVATTEQAQEVCAAIRDCIAEIYDDATAAAIRIQYGGSVSAASAPELFAQPDIDGGLVGGASLKADFGKIVNYNK